MDYKHDENIFNYIKEHPGTNMNTISEETSIGYPSVRLTIARLIESKLLTKDGIKLFISPEKTYVKPSRTIEEEKPRPKMHETLLDPVYKEDFELLVGLGQALLKNDLAGRKIPPELNNAITDIQSMLTQDDLFDYYRTLLFSQLSGNLDFFSQFEYTGPYPTSDRLKEVKESFKRANLKDEVKSLRERLRVSEKHTAYLEEELRKLKPAKEPRVLDIGEVSREEAIRREEWEERQKEIDNDQDDLDRDRYNS